MINMIPTRHTPSTLTIAVTSCSIDTTEEKKRVTPVSHAHDLMLAHGSS
jgi:hypothetical protein